MSKKKQTKMRGAGLVVLILLVVVCIGAVIIRSLRPEAPVQKPRETTAAPAATRPVQTEPVQTVRIEVEDRDPINLGYGLEITDAGRYTGLYMEDGSNEIVSDVMMIVVENSGDSDFQLANITAVCGGEEYRFTLTNLAAGAKVVLLDLDRKQSESGKLDSAVLADPVPFEQPMELLEDTIEIGGLEGMLNVRNLSDSDIDGDIYIYYKYAAQDLYYGGITFRVRIEGGLKAGELRQVPAGHFSPGSCAVVQVTVHG